MCLGNHKENNPASVPEKEQWEVTGAGKELGRGDSLASQDVGVASLPRSWGRG